MGFISDTIWGNIMWTIIHIISFNYPISPTPEKKNYMHQFLINTSRILPCTKARRNFCRFVITTIDHLDDYLGIVPLRSSEYARLRNHIKDAMQYDENISLESVLLPCNYIFSDRYSFSRFCVALHNVVNVHLNRELQCFENVQQRYENFRAGCVTSRQKIQDKRKGLKETGCSRAKLGRISSRSCIEFTNPKEWNSSKRRSRQPFQNSLVIDSDCEPVKIFNQKELDSLDGMQTWIWGPIFWITLHIVSFSVGKRGDVNGDYTEWLLSMGKVLPCKSCRDNFEENLLTTCQKLKICGKHDEYVNVEEVHQFTSESQENFAFLCFSLHNTVNKMLSKPSMTYPRFIKTYTDIIRRGEMCCSIIHISPRKTVTDEKKGGMKLTLK